jgi:hypothetical protein
MNVNFTFKDAPSDYLDRKPSTPS